MTRRIGLAFFYHESHSFSPLLTDQSAFESEALLTGDALLKHYRGTSTEVGGFIDALEELNYTPVSLIAAAAVPAGEVTDEAFDKIVHLAQEQFELAGELDGMLIALHGAMVTPSHRDPETDFVKIIQSTYGLEIPLAVTLDLHANVTADLIDTGVACFGFQTYPHVDMFEQGVRAARFLVSRIENPEPPTQAFVKIPALLPSINMRTAAGPMHELITKAQSFEQEEGIIAVSVFGGFPYADIPGAGASVVVLAHNRDRATAIAEELAQDLWDTKELFVEELPGVSESILRALNPELRHPVVLADIADNPLSGGSADTTALLEEVVRRDLHDVFFGALCDRELVEQAQRNGIGSTFECEFGGKLSPEFGGPVPLTCEVLAVSNGIFINDGPMNAGLEVDVDGAVLVRHRGIDLFVTGRPITANDPNLFRHLGVDIHRYRILVLKVKNHFRAAFEPLVGDIISVDAPGVATNDFRNLAYTQIPTDIWPLNPSRSFSPEVHISEVEIEVPS